MQTVETTTANPNSTNAVLVVVFYFLILIKSIGYESFNSREICRQWRT